MYSAVTSLPPRSLILLMIASGKVFSRPTKTPTRFILTALSFPAIQTKDTGLKPQTHSIVSPLDPWKTKQNTSDVDRCQTGGGSTQTGRYRTGYRRHPTVRRTASMLCHGKALSWL